MPFSQTVPELSDAQLVRISSLVREFAGITLGEQKEGLIRSRLAKRLHTLDLADFQEYLRYVERDLSGHELTCMIDSLTTNKTSFFREPQHFTFLRQHVLALRDCPEIRIWSAGCSSGEEPYSIAMTLRDALPYVGTVDGQQRVAARILATDVSTTMLARVRAGVYAEEALREVPPSIVRRHFTVVQDGAIRYFQVAEPVHRMVYAARLNLVGSWPMQGRFDYIFCRNVMIYFDRQTRQELVQRLWDWLTPGGFLFIGHSESLAGLSHAFRFVQPAVYARD